VKPPRLIPILLACAVAIPAAGGQQIVAEEDFSHGMGRWWAEGGKNVRVEHGRLYVDANDPDTPGGGVATVWYKSPHPGDFELEVDAHVISSAIGANNINLFFSYSDPAGTPLEETRAARRNAEYNLYHRLNGYIVTFLNDAGRARVRIRRNPGFHLLNETFHGECRQGVTYHLRVTKLKGEISFWVDGERLLSAQDPHPLEGGLLGLRTFRTSLWWDNLRVRSLD